MQVSELIDLVSELSFGRSSPTTRERELYLRFLNIANEELWQLVINGGAFLKTQDLFFEEGSSNISVPESFYMKQLYCSGNPLKKCEFSKIFNIPQGQYSLINNEITISKQEILSRKEDPSDNVNKRYIVALLLPEAKKLVEVVQDAMVEASSPVYPIPYHLGLVHGALFYLYLSNKGFSEKIKYQMVAWDEFKKNLSIYYR